jgi:hypothetical protein
MGGHLKELKTKSLQFSELGAKRNPCQKLGALVNKSLLVAFHKFYEANYLAWSD